MTAAKPPARFLRIFSLPGQAKPEDIHSLCRLNWLKPGQFAHARETAICRHCQGSPYLVPAILPPVVNAMGVTILFDQLLYPCTHYQLKVRIAFRLGCDELEEVYLGNQRDVWEACFETAEIGQGKEPIGSLDR